ncbi:PhzF family phenazine biosynthesis protein [Microbacterium gilvum]|uniref:PhzF family phenazine biosynthesis protein n=1 Tax=Microbacterium gilvum TaxID=1336204 RepID=A0ABP8ZTE8_9MICO
MSTHAFSQVDVFAPSALSGNPVAVVHDAVGVDEERMAAFARWTNLSETTFLLPPVDPRADYRLRIFTPGGELPFAGHPTLGSAHAWLESGGAPVSAERIVQECGIGLVELRRDGERLAFAAPELRRSGPVDDDTVEVALAALGVAHGDVERVAWIDNGPGWIGIVLDSADLVRSLRPDFARMGALKVGVLARDPEGAADVEVRAFAPGIGVGEDPVTGSLNAGFAIWLTREGVLPPAYTARQGTALGRAGDVVVTTDADGVVWVGGESRTVVQGTVRLG